MTTEITARESIRRSGIVSRNKPLILLYVVMTVLGTLSLYNAFPTSMKLAYFPFLGIAVVLMIMGYSNAGRLRISIAFLLEYLAYIALMFGLTSIIYALEKTAGSDMFRGYEKLAFQTLTMAITIAAYYLFGEKSVDYTFYGFVGFMLICITLAFKATGPAKALSDIQYFMSSGGDAIGFMKHLELHDAIFGFGIFMLYYAQKGIRKHWKQFVIATVLFAIGFKRIGIIAVVVALMLLYAVRHKHWKIKVYAKAIGWLWIAIGFLYVVESYFGTLTKLAEQLGVDTMGRTELYEFIKQYYRLDVLFIGHGFEFITQLMKTASFGTLNLAKIGAIHNGFLTFYIEFGFIGMLLWMGYWLVWHMKWISKYNEEVVLSYLLITVYLFITYLTDNTAFYFSTGIVSRLVPMAFLKERIE